MVSFSVLPVVEIWRKISQSAFISRATTLVSMTMNLVVDIIAVKINECARDTMV
jgi:hypothetical protein